MRCMEADQAAFSPFAATGTSWASYLAGMRKARSIVGGRVMVIGSERPWVEACALAAGAASVVELAGRRHKLACASRSARGVVAALPKAPLRNMIYTVGGFSATFTWLAAVARYDGEGWEMVASLPQAI